jgi:hypothetical protein
MPLDQVNILVPPSLAGRDLLDAQLMMFGATSNVQVIIH